jgi:MFS family permease
MNRTHLVLFVIQNRTLGTYLAAIQRILISVTGCIALMDAIGVRPARLSVWSGTTPPATLDGHGSRVYERQWRTRYDLSAFQSGLVVSLSLAGALAGSVAAFVFGDRLGRRRELLLAAALYGEPVMMDRPWHAGHHTINQTQTP